MKKIQTTLILLFALFSAFQAQAQTPAAKKLPFFSFFDLNGNVFTSDQVKFENYLLVGYFDPDCDHCNEQAAQIKENMEKLKNVNMVWVSFGDPKSIAGFQKKYFEGYKKVIFLHDPNLKIFTYFPDAVETPTFYLYDRNKNLIGKFIEQEADRKSVV